jgi:plasmid stabilization system protein ParE
VQDIDRQVTYLQERSFRAAENWLKAVEVAVDSMRVDAESHPLIPESDAIERPLRQIMFGRRQYRYRMIYSIDDNAVHVLHVRHGMRRPLETLDVD